MTWIIGTLGIMMGTLVAVAGAGPAQRQLAVFNRKLGVSVLILAVFLLLLTLVNDLILVVR